jgi:ketosteroid isomerase-like protein
VRQPSPRKREPSAESTWRQSGDTLGVAPQNVEIVRSIVEPLEGINLAAIDWDVEAIREALGRAYLPDVELTTLASGLGSGVGEFYRGADGVVRYLREWLEPFSDYHVENLDYIEAGDCVLVPSRQWGVGAGSGARVEIELTTLYELRDGRIARVHQYDTLEEALETAGVRE